MKADLHIHSEMSDGPLCADAIISQAKRSGLGLISITDHDTTHGQDALGRKAALAKLNYIKGIEISAFDKREDVQVHILGYAYQDGELLDSFCDVINRRRRQAGIQMTERIISMGYDITVDDVMEYAKGGIIYRPHIMHALFARGYTGGIFTAPYQEWFGKGGAAYFPFEYLDACEAIEAVRLAGGLAVAAHPASYNNWGCLPRLISAGLQGLEAHHPAHSPVDINALTDFARDNGLFVTGGSDFHGMYLRTPYPIGYGCRPACGAIRERIDHPAKEEHHAV